MCQFELDICPYPHDDPVASTILDWGKNGSWKHCDDPKPWGRLSCGNLSIHHRLPMLNLQRESSGDDEDVTPTSDDHKSQVTRVNRATSLHESIELRVRDVSIDSTSDCDVTSLDAFTAATTPEIVNKSIDLSSMLNSQCEWCTIKLKAMSYKSIAVQDEAKENIAIMEESWAADHELTELRKEIKEKEKSLSRLRHKAWLIANGKIHHARGK